MRRQYPETVKRLQTCRLKNWSAIALRSGLDDMGALAHVLHHRPGGLDEEENDGGGGEWVRGGRCNNIS